MSYTRQLFHGLSPTFKSKNVTHLVAFTVYYSSTIFTTTFKILNLAYTMKVNILNINYELFMRIFFYLFILKFHVKWQLTLEFLDFTLGNVL